MVLLKQEKMIDLLQRSMKYQLSENKYFLTPESKKWILNELPKIEKEIEREIQLCWKDLKN